MIEKQKNFLACYVSLFSKTSISNGEGREDTTINFTFALSTPNILIKFHPLKFGNIRKITN